MSSPKKIQRAEWMLFLAPLLALGSSFVARPLRQTLFPVPTPTPTPAPVPTPIPKLWHKVFDRTPSLLPSPDGKVIYTAGIEQYKKQPKILIAWHTQNGRIIHTFPDFPGYLSQMAEHYSSSGWALSDDGTRIAYTWDGPLGTERTGIYNTATGKRLRYVSPWSYGGHPRFLPHSHTLYVGLLGKYEVWNTDNGKLVHRGFWREKGTVPGWFRSPAFSPDGKQLAVIRSEGGDMGNYPYANGRRDEIGLFSTRSWRPTQVFSWPNTNIRAIGFVDNGQSLVVSGTSWHWFKSKSGNSDFYPISTVRLVDCKTRHQRIVRRLPKWAGNYDKILTVSPDGRFFALADTFGNEKETTFIEIREARTGSKIASLQLLHASHMQAMAFAPDNSALYYCADFTQYYGAEGIQRWQRKKWKIGVLIQPQS